MIEFGGRLLNALTIAPIGEPVNDRHPDLAEDASGQVTGTLGCDTHSEAVLAPLLCDRIESVEMSAGELVADRDVKELVRFVDGNDDRRRGIRAVPRPGEQRLSEDVDDDFSQVICEGQVLERDPQDMLVLVFQPVRDLFDDVADSCRGVNHIHDLGGLEQIADAADQRCDVPERRLIRIAKLGRIVAIGSPDALVLNLRPKQPDIEGRVWVFDCRDVLVRRGLMNGDGREERIGDN